MDEPRAPGLLAHNSQMRVTLSSGCDLTVVNHMAPVRVTLMQRPTELLLELEHAEYAGPDNPQELLRNAAWALDQARKRARDGDHELAAAFVVDAHRLAIRGIAELEQRLFDGRP